MRLNGNGDALFKNTTNSATGFQIQVADGSALFTADTSAYRIGIGTNTLAPTVTLDVIGAMQQTGWTTTNTDAAGAGQWTKLATCNIKQRYSICNMKLQINGTKRLSASLGYAGPTTSTVSAYVEQSAAMGSAPAVSLTMEANAEYITQDDVKAYITTVNGTDSVVDLWGRINNTYEQWYLVPIMNQPLHGAGSNNALKSRWQLLESQGLQSATPSGTPITTWRGNLVGDTLRLDSGIVGGLSQIFRSTETAAATYEYGGKATAYRINTNSTDDPESFTTTIRLTGHEENGSILFVSLEAQKTATASTYTHTTNLEMGPAGQAGDLVASVSVTTSNSNAFTVKTFVLFKINGDWRVIVGSSPVTTSDYDQADLAEHVPFTGVRPEAGQLLTVGDDPNNPAKASVKLTNGKGARILGVVTSTPAEVYGREDDNTVPMALTGRVPVKVSLENGPIQPGDFLTASSTPGVAMRATEPGQMIGTAYNGYTGNGEAVVMTQLAFGYNVPAPSQSVQGADQLQGQVNTLQSSLTGLTDRVNAMGTNFNTVNLGATTLTVTGNATVQGDLTVGGTAKVGTLELAGHLVTKGDLPTLQLQAAAGSTNVVAPKLPANATIKGNDTSGTITLVAGDDATADHLLKVVFAKAFAEAPQVVITPVGKEGAYLGAYVDGISQGEFFLGATNQPQSQKTYVFNYHVMQAASAGKP
jgi:hypothetical protein